MNTLATPTSPDVTARPDRRSTVGRALLAVCAVAALGASFSAVPAVADAGPATLLVEIWRGTGLVVFAGLFGLLAWRPTAFPGVLELAIAHKAALAIAAVANGAAQGATETAIADGLVTVTLVSAYVLTRAWTAWPPRRPTRG